ncbi:skin secretory protein xP2-like [Oryza brachyantha]|uniref:skin secretory protein xP2-like n=1 Tax=Oryza brachyantha TaxID=4533 RepID=UPI001ADBC92E|nr:skin secretory protein xP2-like [Oryza brachyantha]
MAAMLSLRATDCRLHDRRGVHAPTYVHRRPMWEQSAAAVAVSSAPPRSSRLPGSHGRRGEGRQARGRGSSPRAGSRPQTGTLTMENVVILKRGEPIAPEIRAKLTVAAPAADQSDGASAAAENAEPAPAAAQLQRVAPAPAPAKEAENAVVPELGVTPAKSQPVADVEKYIAPARRAEAVAEATAGQRRQGAPATATKLYWGPSFKISPDPSVLPIPTFTLKPRGGRSAACAS